MTKWLIYLGVLFVLIVITVISITASKAGFLMVEECEYAYRPCSIEEKYTLTFHGNQEPLQPFPLTAEKIPEGLEWKNGAGQRSFADPNAKRGGTMNLFLITFPQTLRQLGLNANTRFREYLDLNDLALVDMHPVTDAFIPALASEWAIGPDRRTVYFRLDPDARWSDGVPVTADDFLCRLTLSRAPGIVDPWANNYFTEQLEEILKFDDHTIAIRLPKRKPDMIFSANLDPIPYHFYGNFIRNEQEFRGKTAFYTFKNNRLPIPDQLMYYQIKEQLESLEIFLISLNNKLAPDTPASTPEPAPAPVDKTALLKEVVDTLAEASRLSDALEKSDSSDRAAAAQQLVKMSMHYNRFTPQLASIKPTPEQAKKT